MREHLRKPQLLIGFLLSFLAGILLANAIGVTPGLQDTLAGFGSGQSESRMSGSMELFFYVAARRLPLFFVLSFFGTGPRGVWMHRLFAAWLGLCYGFFCVLSVTSFGAKGVLLCFLVLFPQILLYVPAYLGLLELGLGETTPGRCKRALLFLILFVLLQVGILLESYVNPMILKKVLNFL
jgi:hypothetical protein